MTEPPAPALQLEGITKRFGNVVAVAGVDLSVQQGEIVALLGPNGAGKTSLIDIALGLANPTGGRARVLGMSPRDAVHQGRVGAMTQTGGLLRDISVRETLEVIASLQGVPDRVDEVLRLANLEALARRRVSKCSGGEQQRLKFAVALLPDPTLIFLDEPTTGMDVTTRREFWESMQGEAAAGRTIIFATHYLEEASQFAERIVLMGRGRVLVDGSIHDVRGRAGGRQVSATLPDGRRVTEKTADSDDLARRLLAEGATDLVITEPSLDDVFVALTKDAR